ALVRARKELPHMSLRTSGCHASTGPRSCERGKAMQRTPIVEHPEASTGPRSCERGKEAKKKTQREHAERFNGAALVRARKDLSIQTNPRSPCRFNGAALVRARKAVDWGTPFLRRYFASTGPRSCERGKSGF